MQLPLLRALRAANLSAHAAHTAAIMALSLLKDAWRDHRTACVAAAAAAGALALWAARRRANALPAPSPGGRLLGQAERVVYEYGRQMNGCMMVRPWYTCSWLAHGSTCELTRGHRLSSARFASRSAVRGLRRMS